jgi:hypothetical protein
MRTMLLPALLILSIQLCAQEKQTNELLATITADNNQPALDDLHQDQVLEIFSTALNSGQSYPMLEELCKDVGARLSGSPEAAKAVEWSTKKMESYGFDNVFLQPVMVPHWVRGAQETAKIISGDQDRSVNILALGNSVGTGAKGITAQVVEVQSLDQLATLGEAGIKGKIVFFNRPLDQPKLTTFSAYGGAVDQRVWGASEAARHGAIGVIVRTVGTAQDDFPHTGTLIYKEDAPQIPAAAISTNDADVLYDMLTADAKLKFHFQMNCEMLPDVLSYNVIGEIKGSTNPEQYIVVGGHLDSWDVGDGAHDDGAGCVQSIEALRLFKTLNIKPKHTLRAVMFMNEENGLRGGNEYARLAKENKEIHLAAIESDAGGFSPKGFRFSGTEQQRNAYLALKKYFAPFDIYSFEGKGGGADIGPLADQGPALIGLYPDSQRYFDYHHANSDTFDKVNRRELELGAASMASLMYLIDQIGLE